MQGFDAHVCSKTSASLVSSHSEVANGRSRWEGFRSLPSAQSIATSTMPQKGREAAAKGGVGHPAQAHGSAQDGGSAGEVQVTRAERLVHRTNSLPNAHVCGAVTEQEGGCARQTGAEIGKARVKVHHSRILDASAGLTGSFGDQ
mmetsp:Transcript_17443/g.56004  ORF Transcript_17443/g.56004 Transcript_17443/m.56004 type:complete len:145 (-) Transcript_17443:399-833(-)